MADTLRPDHRQFLNNLRRSGVVNMHGAGPYLAEAFELSAAEARRVLVAWMQSFDPKVDR